MIKVPHNQTGQKQIRNIYYETTYKILFLSPCTAAAAAAAKLLQSCPTLCNPIDGSPPGSPVPGILQARILEWVAISFSNVCKWKIKVKLLSRVRLLVTSWTAAYLCPWDFPGKSTGLCTKCYLKGGGKR